MVVCKTEAGDRRIHPEGLGGGPSLPKALPVPGFRAGSAAAGVEGAGRGGQATPGAGPG